MNFDARRRGRLQLSFMVLAFALLLPVFGSLDVNGTLGLFRQVGPGLLCALIPISMAVVIDTLGWQWLLGRTGRAGEFRTLLQVRMASEVMTLGFPAGPLFSDSLSVWLLHQRASLGLRAALLGVVCRKLVVVMTHGLVMLFGAVLGGALLAAMSARLGLPGLGLIQATVGGVLALGSACLLAAALSPRMDRRLLGWCRAIPVRVVRHAALRLRHRVVATGHRDARQVGPSARGVGMAALFYLLFWVLEAGETWVIVRLFGAEIGFRQILAFDATVALLRSAAFFLPAGLGLQELAYLCLFQSARVADPARLTAAFSIVRRARELLWVGLGMACWARIQRPFLPEGAVSA